MAGNVGSCGRNSYMLVHTQKYKLLTISYPSRALKGQPTMAPAAVPSTARLGRPWNQPVIATTVLYIQNVLGRKAA